MPLPAPLETTVPSAADGTTLSARIYLPRTSSAQDVSTAKQPQCRRAAVVAHPYASLGGSFDDPVVLLVAEQLFDSGFVVLTFNFRRRASWTARPERKDYISVARFLVHFVQMLPDGTSPVAASEQLDLVLAGYSYGAMIASQIPPVQHLLDEAQHDDRSKRLAQQAADMVASSNSAPKSISPERLGRTGLVSTTRYLLVSPVLPPVTTLLTFSLRALDYTYLKTNDTLALFGTKDHFTSGERLSKWAKNLGINARAVEGTGHFWIEDGAAQSLASAVSQWATKKAVKAESGAS